MGRLSDHRLNELRRSIYGDPTSSGMRDAVREIDDRRTEVTSLQAALASEKQQGNAAWRALELALKKVSEARFRAKARAWFGRRLVLSVVP